MKKTVIYILSLIFLAALFAACTEQPQADSPAPSSEPEAAQSAPAQSAPEDKSPIKVGIRNDTPGFAYLNIDTGEVNGFEVDLMRAVGGLLERDVEFIIVNDTTREKALKAGDIDLIAATFTITDDRKSEYLFTQPYYTDKLAFLVPKDSDAQNVADLDSAKVGVADNTTAVDDLNSAAQNKNITVEAVPFETYTDAKKALFNGEIDSIYMDASVLRSYQDGRVLEEYFTPQPYGIAALKENSELLNAVDSAINFLESDGTLDALADHWEIDLD